MQEADHSQAFGQGHNHVHAPVVLSSCSLRSPSLCATPPPTPRSPFPPQSADRRVLAAAAEVIKKGLARVTLLGKPAEVQATAEKFNIDISGCDVLDFLVGAGCLRGCCLAGFTWVLPGWFYVGARPGLPGCCWQG